MLTPLVVQDDLAGVLIFGHRQPSAFGGAIEPDGDPGSRESEQATETPEIKSPLDEEG